MTEEQMKKRLFELYRLDWLAIQGYSLEDVMSAMDEYPGLHDDYIESTIEDVDTFGTHDMHMYANTVGIFHKWEKESDGLNGNLWTPFDEFCNTTLINHEYITSLIERINRLDSDTATELTDAYNKWLEKGKMTEEEMKRRLFELYQLDWMMTHGYSLYDIIKGIGDHKAVNHDNYVHDSEVGMYADIESIFAEWEEYVGFSGNCIYNHFHEFCREELTDSGYIKGLLDRVPSEEGLRDAYNKWLKDN